MLEPSVGPQGFYLDPGQRQGHGGAFTWRGLPGGRGCAAPAPSAFGVPPSPPGSDTRGLFPALSRSR